MLSNNTDFADFEFIDNYQARSFEYAKQYAAKCKNIEDYISFPFCSLSSQRKLKDEFYKRQITIM